MDCVLNVSAAGEYFFKFQGSQTRAQIGDTPIDLSGARPVRLESGKHPLRLFLKKRDDNDHVMAVDLKWRTPGAAEFAPVVLADEAPVQQPTPFFPGAPAFTEKTHPNFREFSFDVKKAGYFRLGTHGLRGACGSVALDGWALFPLDSAYATIKSGFWQELAVRRWLEPGRHTLRITSYKNSEKWSPFIQPVQPADASDSVAIWVKDRADMIFELGETMAFAMEQSTATDTGYNLEIMAQRGGLVWQKKITLPANAIRSYREIVYNCPQEGAFEWRLLRDSGEVVTGPWQFAVVNPAPLGIPRPNSPETRRECDLVDRVDCVDTGHVFRDNQSSRVVKNYRITGTKSEYKGLDKVDGKWQKVEKGGIHCTDQDWFAYTMKVKSPGKPHRLTAWVPTDKTRMIAVQVFDQVTGSSAGAVMCVKEPTADGKPVPLSCVLWPNGDAIDVTAFAAPKQQAGSFLNESAVVSFELFEYPDGLPALPEADAGWGRLQGVRLVGRATEPWRGASDDADTCP